MRPLPRRLLGLLAFAALALPSLLPAAPALAALPPAVKRVVFLGDSITQGGFYTVCVETYFRTRYPASAPEFINVGLSSETVSGLSEPNHASGAFPRPDLHERLERVLARLKPDLVFACYGMNDGIYLPYDEARARAYYDGIVRLRSAVLAAGAKLVHLTPPVYVDVKGNAPTYAAVLERYAAWLVARRADGWDVADIHTAMARELAAQRARDPAFTFARDGVHPDDRGHWIMARTLLRHLGAADLPDTFEAADAFSGVPAGAEILKLVRTRSGLLRDAWLSAIGHKRPGKPGPPLADAERRAADLEKQIRALQASVPAAAKP
jgi:lysophospholipase L1-like esterase